MERDVIMREIRQLAVALAQALLHIKMKRYDDAVAEIDRSIARVGLVVPDRLILLGKNELLDHLTSSGVIDSEYGSSIALLLRQRGKALLEMGENQRAIESLDTARSILEIVRDSPSESVPFDLNERINSLRKLADEIQT